MDIQYTSPTDLAFTELLKQTDAWKKARVIAIDARATGRKIPDAVEDIAAALESEINIAEMIDSAMPDGADQDQVETLKKYYAYLAAAAVVADIEGQALPVIPMITGGIQVLRHQETAADEDGETTLAYPVIQAIVTPFTPLSIADEFRETILQTFPNPIKESQNPKRDREWFAQNVFGDKTCKDIALTDPRAKLSPEARAFPDDYPEDVKRATALVTKAVQHYKREWKRIFDSLSTSTENHT